MIYINARNEETQVQIKTSACAINTYQYWQPVPTRAEESLEKICPKENDIFIINDRR